jgi:methylthioribulose-1-phosphate dehydratase
MAAASRMAIPPAWAAEALIKAGRRADAHGWVPGTAGNFSVRLDSETCAITQSGRHKAFLSPGDVMVMGLDGAARGPGVPSYETGLHLALYRRDPAIGAVVHGHSVPATVLSMRGGAAISLAGYELLKVLGGSPDPDAPSSLAIFDNDQDISRLAGRIDSTLGGPAALPGYLIRGHGVYVWGTGMDQALARLEALEFILACELEKFRRTA